MKVINSIQFGHLIYKTRKRAGLTQAELAAASATGERFIRELEKGKSSCQLGKSLLIAQMLGITIEATAPLDLGD